MNPKCRQLFENAVKPIVLGSRGSPTLAVAAPENRDLILFHTDHVASSKLRATSIPTARIGGHRSSHILFSSPVRLGPSRISGAGLGPLCENRLHQAARKAGVPSSFPREAWAIRLQRNEAFRRRPAPSAQPEPAP